MDDVAQLDATSCNGRASEVNTFILPSFYSIDDIYIYKHEVRVRGRRTKVGFVKVKKTLGIGKRNTH